MINKAPFTLAPPSLDDFKGQNVGAYLRALTKFLVALVRWLTNELAGLVAAIPRIALIQTSTAVTGRVGTVPGTGTGNLIGFDGTDLTTGAAITLRTIAAAGHASGKFGVAVRLAGIWWIVSLEC